MDYRITKQKLLDVVGQWNGFCRRKVHLIACGGTALTLLDIKNSTKDVDFLIPVGSEYKYLIKILEDLGYQRTIGSGWQRKDEVFIFDLFPGKRIHTTELMESPLDKGNHELIKRFSYLYIGILNNYDLIVSKIFRGTNVDYEDCVELVKARKDEIDIKHLESHFKNMAKYDISENRIIKNLEYFISLLREEKIYG